MSPLQALKNLMDRLDARWQQVDALGIESVVFADARSAIIDPQESFAAEPNWIVNSLGELGVEILGRCFFLYKGENIEYSEVSQSKDGVCLHDDGTPMMYRMVGKREFGETCKPAIHFKVENGAIYDRTPFPYREKLVYTPGLSFGQPEDGDWKPLLATSDNNEETN